MAAIIYIQHNSKKLKIKNIPRKLETYCKNNSCQMTEVHLGKENL